MQFGPTSVFSSKRDVVERGGAALSRTSSSSNMFMMLGSETPAPAPVRPNRPPSSRNASVDLSHGVSAEPGQRPKHNLLPRSVPVPEKGEASPTPADEVEEGEIRDGEAAEPEMSKEQAERKIDEDIREFFAIRNLDEADDYFIKLPPEYRALLVEKVVMRAFELSPRKRTHSSSRTSLNVGAPSACARPRCSKGSFPPRNCSAISQLIL